MSLHLLNFHPPPRRQGRLALRIRPGSSVIWIGEDLADVLALDDYMTLTVRWQVRQRRGEDGMGWDWGCYVVLQCVVL